MGLAEIGPGKVLLAGGYGAKDPLASVELLDVAVGTTCAHASLPEPRVGLTATRLLDGAVLLAGGTTAGVTPTPTASLRLTGDECGQATLEPSTSPLGKRWGHTAVALADGRVLVCGGYVDGTSGPTATASLYDPSTDAWAQLPPMHWPRAKHVAVALADGRVLVAGGFATKAETLPTATAEVWSPSSGAWEIVAPLSSARADHAAVREPSGAVRVIGGRAGADALASVERFDPVTGEWSLAPPLQEARYLAAAAALGADRVLVVGGMGKGFLASAEVSRGGGAFVSFPSMTRAHSAPVALSLADGSVLVLGGVDDNGPTRVAEVARLLPRGAACELSSACESGACVDGVCCESECKGACAACSDARRGDALGDGRCGAVAAGRDPDDECAASSAASCGHTGACDGQGSCAFHSAALSCGPPGCDGERARALRCDGAGACVALAAYCAGGLVCRGACLLTCVDDRDCRATHRCVQGECQVREFSSVCAGDGLSVLDPSGAQASCGAYRCAEGACLGGCESGRDCAPGHRCSSSGACVLEQAPSEPGGCEAGAASPASALPAVLALVALSLGRWLTRTR